jgi:hypothetical protein
MPLRSDGQFNDRKAKDEQANDRRANLWVSRVVPLLGFCIFVAAFFLPAVRAGAPGSDVVVFPGWKCASVALTETVGLFGKSGLAAPSFPVWLVVFSGWINPLVLLLLCFSFSRRFLTLRRVLAVLTVLCMAATWTFFALQKVTPLIGHFLWIAGALLVLASAIGAPRASRR